MKRPDFLASEWHTLLRQAGVGVSECARPNALMRIDCSLIFFVIANRADAGGLCLSKEIVRWEDQGMPGLDRDVVDEMNDLADSEGRLTEEVAAELGVEMPKRGSKKKRVVGSNTKGVASWEIKERGGFHF